MWTKGLLLAAPTLVSLFLLQSYFWVPSFEDQARGDPGRLTRYISASIGDASILNPTLAADTASSEINALVFEGLIDRNLDLSFRGRLAESWRISEEAYLYADESVRLRDGPRRAERAPRAAPGRARRGRPGPPEGPGHGGAPGRDRDRPAHAAAERAPVPRRAAARSDPGDDPPAAPHQVHPDRGRPGLLPGARPAAGRLRDDARSPPLRHRAHARARAPRRRGARPAHRGEPGHRLHAPARHPVPRRPGAHGAGRQVHLRDDRRSAEPLAPRAGLRAGQARGHPRCPHGPGHVQAALPAGLRELGDGHPARAPPQSGAARRRGARRRTRPRQVHGA